MSRSRLAMLKASRKAVAKAFILSWLAFLGISGLMLASRWFGGINASEETNEIFNAAAELPPELVEAIYWEADGPNMLRPMEPLTRVAVSSAWIRAWEQLSIVAQTGDTAGLEVYFSNSALEALLDSMPDTNGLPVHQLGHTLRVDFYSQDGQVIGLTADQVHLVRSVEVDGVLGWAQTKESYEAVLLLEDGNWRIQHWVRRDVEHRWWTDPAPPPSGPTLTADDAVVFDEPLNGINYYPRDTPFDEFWPNYDPDIVDADLDAISALGLDSIRIFLPFDELLGRWTTEEELAPVLDLMDRAAERDLGVVVTLFDGRTDHRTDKWDSDKAHLEAVVPALADHPALVMWDLKNEPDRDIGANGVDRQLLYAWIGHVAHVVRELDLTTPMTVGWSTPQAALEAPVHTDVVSFHYYGPADDLTRWTELLAAHAAPRPVMLTEYGLPTWNSVFPGGHTEAEQAVYVAETRKIAAESGLAGTMVWTLWDLYAPPPDAGSFPWQSGPQVNLGLVRADGTPKPAAAVVHPTFDLATVQPLGPLHRLNKTFWRLVVLVIGAGVGAKAAAMLWRRLRGREKSERRKTQPRRRRTYDQADPGDQPGEAPDPASSEGEAVVTTRAPEPTANEPPPTSPAPADVVEPNRPARARRPDRSTQKGGAESDVEAAAPTRGPRRLSSEHVVGLQRLVRRGAASVGQRRASTSDTGRRSRPSSKDAPAVVAFERRQGSPRASDRRPSETGLRHRGKQIGERLRRRQR